MILQRMFVAACMALLLASCGGGGGSSGGSSSASAPPPPPAPAPAVSITLTTPPIVQNLDYGDDFSVTLEGSWSASNLGTASVYLQVVDSNNTFTPPAVQLAPANNTYRLTANFINTTPAGERTGTLTVRACKDLACTQLYANASASVSYRLVLTPVGEWETVQRDATHNGYVPIRLDPTRFTKAWERDLPKDPAAADYFIGRPATGNGVAYLIGSNVRSDRSLFSTRLFALDEKTGAIRWSYDAGEVASPAARDGIVYLPTRNSNSAITALD